MRSRSVSQRRSLPIWARVTAGGIIALLLWGGYQFVDQARRAPGDGAPLVEFTVDGLDCPFWCAVRLTDTIDALDGAAVERWDQAAGTVVVRHDPARQSLATLHRLIDEAGFPVVESRPLAR